jgi:Fur family transcriptional regulator, ferric uptake regulator
MAVPSRIEQLCLDKGMKMTEQRRVIARVLSESSDHPHVEEVHRRANMLDPRISIATVYRTVRLFEEANIIERREFGDGRSRYEEVDEKHHHHHLINLKTGEVIEFENEQLEKLKRKICQDLGFEMVGDRLELFGIPLEGPLPDKPRK